MRTARKLSARAQREASDAVSRAARDLTEQRGLLRAIEQRRGRRYLAGALLVDIDTPDSAKDRIIGELSRRLTDGRYGGPLLGERALRPR